MILKVPKKEGIKDEEKFGETRNTEFRSWVQNQYHYLTPPTNRQTGRLRLFIRLWLMSYSISVVRSLTLSSLRSVHVSRFRLFQIKHQKYPHLDSARCDNQFFNFTVLQFKHFSIPSFFHCFHFLYFFIPSFFHFFIFTSTPPSQRLRRTSQYPASCTQRPEPNTPNPYRSWNP